MSTSQNLTTNVLTGKSSRSPQVSAEIDVVSRPVCSLCGQKGGPLYTRLTDWLFGAPGSWAIRHCSACDLAWLDPQPIPEHFDKLYSQYYTHDTNAPITRLARLKYEILQCVLARLGYAVDRPSDVLPRLLSFLPSVARAAALDVVALPESEVGTLLDVGCGNGDFIARMSSLGWRVSGVDPDPGAVSEARRKGLEVFTGVISDVPDAVYDVITLNHVIEHAIDPIDLLRECRKRLRQDGGRLIISTPNLNSLGHRWFGRYWRGLEVPRHMVLFSLSALRKCVEGTGMRVHSLRTETRMARPAYRISVCAQQDEGDLGGRRKFKLSTNIAAAFFRVLEDVLSYFAGDAGEEIFCVCAARKEGL